MPRLLSHKPLTKSYRDITGATKSPIQRTCEAAGQDRLVGKLDCCLLSCCNRHGLEPHWRLVPAELIPDLLWLRRLDLEAGSLEVGQASVCPQGR